MKILVTGGTGYIGSHTCVELINAGYEVVILDSLENSFASVLSGIENITGKKPVFYQVDLRDNQALEKVFQEEKEIVAVIHFAAYKAVGESFKHPLKYYSNNLVSLINLLQIMGKFNCTDLVFSSSCTVYGDSEILPVTEAMPTQRPTSPYGNTKKVCEEIIQDVIKISPLNSICLRYFNPVGAHPTAEIGEHPVGTPNNLVPFITETAIGIRAEITIFGDDYPTKDGTCVRDYIHVVDIAKAHVLAIERLLKKRNKVSFEVFNLGTGHGFSVLEVIKAFEDATGVKLNYKIGHRREGDIAAVYADTTLANQELGWKAQEPLTHMMQSAWKWQQKLNK